MGNLKRSKLLMPNILQMDLQNLRKTIFGRFYLKTFFETLWKTLEKTNLSDKRKYTDTLSV